MNEKRILAWQLYAQTLLLLVLYSAASLMTAIKFMPSDPLSIALPYMEISSLSHVLIELAILTGLFATSVYFLFTEVKKIMLWVYRAWTAFLVITVIAGLSDMFTGRHLLELPLLLDAALFTLVVAWSYVLFTGKDNAGKLVLMTGMGFVITGILVSLFPANNPLNDRILRVITVNMRFFVGYPLTGLAILYWLYNDIPINAGAGILAAVGSIVSIAPLNAIGVINLPAVILVPLIFIGMFYVVRALTSSTRAWQNVGILLMALGMGVLGTLFVIPSVGSYAVGTRLADLQITLVTWSVMLFILSSLSDSLVNTQIETTTYGNSLTFWLVSGGIVAGTQALLLAGVVQLLLERVLGVGYLDTQTVLVPLYVLWIVGILIWSVGIAKYAYHFLGSGMHLPKYRTAEES